MKKVIRLTESDLTRIVRRVIKEGGFEGIKRELESGAKVDNLAISIMNGIGKLIIGFGKLKSIIKGDSIEYLQYDVAKELTKNLFNLQKKILKLERLVSSFKKRDMKLSKGDLEDYDIDLESLLKELEMLYDKISELQEMSEDDVTTRNLNGLEKTVIRFVELLDSIPN